MIGHVRLTISCVAVALGGLALASPAVAGWSRPAKAIPFAAEARALATSPTRGAALAWIDPKDPVLKLRRIGPGGRLGRVTSVPGPVERESFPRMAMADSGAVLFLWTQWDAEVGATLLARRVGRRGRLGPVRTLDRAADVSDDLEGARLAMDAAGNATIAWRRVHIVPGPYHGDRVTGSEVCIRRLGASGSLGPVVCLPSEGGFDGSPRLAVEPSGRGALTWIRQLNRRFTVRAVLIGRDGTLGRPLDVADPHEVWNSGDAPVAVDRRGRATIAWSPGGVEDGLGIRRVSPSGLGPLRYPASGKVGPRVAVTPSGAATVAWVGTDENRVEAVRVRPDGKAGPVRSISGPSSVSSALGLEVVADGLGNTTVVYNAERRGHRPRSVVQARRFSTTGRLGKASNLFPLGRPGIVFFVDAAADARGVVTVLVGTRVSRFVP